MSSSDDFSLDIEEENISEINKRNFNEENMEDSIEENMDEDNNNLGSNISAQPKKKIRTKRNRNIYRYNDGTPIVQRTNHGMVEIVGHDGLYIKENTLPTQAKYVVHTWQKKRKHYKTESEIDQHDEDEELSDSDYEYIAPATVHRISDHMEIEENLDGEFLGNCLICDQNIFTNQDIKEVQEFGNIHLKCFYLCK